MKRHFLVTAMIFSCIMVANAQGKKKEMKEGATVQSVVQVLREAIYESEAYSPAGFPRFKSGTVELKTTVAKEGSIGISFLVFTIGSKVKTEDVSTLTLELVPTATEALTLKSDLKLALSKAIAEAKEGYLAANAPSGNLPRLAAKSITVSIKFTVSLEGEGGLEVKLLPISLKIGGSLSKAKIHTLTMTFSNGPGEADVRPDEIIQ